MMKNVTVTALPYPTIPVSVQKNLTEKLSCLRIWTMGNFEIKLCGYEQVERDCRSVWGQWNSPETLSFGQHSHQKLYCFKSALQNKWWHDRAYQDMKHVYEMLNSVKSDISFYLVGGPLHGTTVVRKGRRGRFNMDISYLYL